jgi:putative hydrolase of the HAD superfamily
MARGILFDLGGTLIRVGDPARVVASFLDERGFAKSLQDVSAAIAGADRSFEEDYFVNQDYWREWNRRILERLGIPNRGDLASYIDSHWFEKMEVSLYPEVLDVLKELKERDVPMGTVTNGLSSDLPHLVDEVGLSGYFKVGIAADHAGRKKPNPRIFLLAAREMGLSPRDLIFVGDEPDLDYRPAEAVGMVPILVDREGKHPLARNVIGNLRGVLDYL